MTLKADVAIVGGGIAGFAAAVSSSRGGKDVLLIERKASVGGDSAYANVGTICGAFYRSYSKTPRLAGYSFNKEFIDALEIRDHIKPSMYTEGLHIIPYEWSNLQQLYVDMLENANVTCLFEGELKQLGIENQVIRELQVLHKHDLLTIEVGSVVDCTGQAWVSQLAGIETIKEKNYQAASQIFRLSNVSDTNEFSLNMALKRAVVKNTERLQWPSSYKSISVVPGSLRSHRVDLKFTLPENITDSHVNDQTFRDKSAKRTEELILILKAEVESLSDAITELIFPLPGVRVVQRSKGKYILTEDDVMSCSDKKDGVATGTWPIEVWNNDGSLEMKYLEEERGYQIPAGCLQSEVIHNLYFAGKNISATERAIASARVMGTALQTGYAAGKMACATNEVELKAIIERLHHELQQVR